MRIRLLGTVGALVLLGAGALVAASPAGAATVFNVRTYGAKGDGKAIDSPAINKAIAAAASGAGGGTVLFPAGTYLSRSIHLKSNVTLQLSSGATVRAAASGMDAPEPNAFSQWQDFGHSHFHNALMWGDGVHDVTITGAGTIDGAGLIRDNKVPNGVGDKALSLKLCSNIHVNGVTFTRGGHYQRHQQLERGDRQLGGPQRGRRGGAQERLRPRAYLPQLQHPRARHDDPVDREQRHPVRLGDVR
ncbi:MAG: hypothetical protein E6G35_12295 [Actinobacteria bacterium]|nr:MAG: hypothetical protein E6G35_12295 [Actinomycetota bacterium]